MSLLTKLQSTIFNLEKAGHYSEASELYAIVTDIAFLEEKKLLTNQFKKARNDLNHLKCNLESYGFIQAASQVDIIQRDIEAKLISFSEVDPISSVLSSYKLMHKLASIPSNNTLLKQLEEIISNESLSEAEIVRTIRGLLLGLPEQEKDNLLYVLEKEHNFTFPIEKSASQERKKQEEEEICLSKAETPQQRQKCLHPSKKTLKMHHSYPSSPNIWSGWSYESPVPYQQQNQLNFWSLAGLKPFTKRI